MKKLKILKEFSILNCISNYEKLEEYVDFCLKNSLSEKNKSSAHHILPAAKTLPFKKFSNLQKFEWNKAELSYYNHYYAHYLLAQAINHIAISSAFLAMHNKDVKLNRITENELISEHEYTLIYEIRNNHLSQYRTEKIEFNGKLMSRAQFYKINSVLSEEAKQNLCQRMKENNIVNLPGVLKKMRKTKSETFINGKNIDTISAERAAKTMKTEFINDDGKITTIYIENGKKISDFLRKEFIDENGNTTTHAKERGKRQQRILREKGKFYTLKNIFDDTINEILSAAEIRNISPGLDCKTKENFLGKSKFGQTMLKNKNKEHLIGLYVEILPKVL